MKIAIIGPAYPLRGGIANFNEALCLAFQTEGHESFVVSFSRQYPEVLFPGKTQLDEGREAPADMDIVSIIDSVNPLSWRKAVKHVLNKKPDLVIVRYWMPFMAPALGVIAKGIRKKGIKVVAITDNIIPHESRVGDKQLTSWFVKQCDGFIAMSRTVLEELDQFSPKGKKVYMPHPIYSIFGEKIQMDVARQKLGLPATGKLILFFGLVRKYKGLDLLLQALADERLKEMKVTLVVAGEFYEDPEHYEAMIKELGLEGTVLLHNRFIPEDDVKYYFSAADIVAQTYITATQSGVTQIAYNFDVPMLVTNVGGLPEIVPHEKVGYVCEKEPRKIADSLCDFFQNNRYEEFSVNVAEEKKRFEWPTFVKGVLQLHSELK